MSAARTILMMVFGAALVLAGADGADAQRDDRFRRPLAGAIREKIVEKAKEEARAKAAAAIAARIREVQAALNYFGFDAGPVDGAYGDRTGDAIARYAEYIGLPPLRLIGPVQIGYLLDVEHLARSGSPEVARRLETVGGEPRALLRSYMADPVKEVEPDPAKIRPRTIQATLNALGHDAGEVDGAIGPATQAAIDRWRASNGSDAHGAMSNAEKVALVLESWRRVSERVQQPVVLRAPLSQWEKDWLRQLDARRGDDAAGPGIDWQAPPFSVASARLDKAAEIPALFVLWQDRATCADAPCTLELYLWQPDQGAGAEAGDYVMIGSYPFTAEVELGGQSHGGMREFWLDGWLMQWTGSEYNNDTSLAAPADPDMFLQMMAPAFDE